MSQVRKLRIRILLGYCFFFETCLTCWFSVNFCPILLGKKAMSLLGCLIQHIHGKFLTELPRAIWRLEKPGLCICWPLSGSAEYFLEPIRAIRNSPQLGFSLSSLSQQVAEKSSLEKKRPGQGVYNNKIICPSWMVPLVPCHMSEIQDQKQERRLNNLYLQRHPKIKPIYYLY